MLGPFDTLGTRNMVLRVQDMYGNTTLAPLSVEVYAPIPQIQGVSTTGMLSGRIGESLSAEPIHFFRIREGDALSMLFPEPTLTIADGGFLTGSVFRGSGALLTYS